MALQQRLDIGRLDRAKRTGAGGARVPAAIARTGVQVYTDASGREVREYRSPDEVFSQASLDSLGAVPVTIGHPGSVDATNWRRHAVGHVSDAPAARRQDGPQEWLETSVIVSDAAALSRVSSGDLVEVSMGYTADVIPESGVTPGGERYDAVQRNIRFNHLALLEVGRARAGAGARLRLDSNGDIEVKQDSADAKRVKVDGIDCEYGSETHVQMLERRADAASALVATRDADLKAKDAEIGALKAKLDAVPAPVNVEALVATELKFRADMLPLLPKDYKFDGKSRDDVRYDAVGAEAAAKIRALPEGQREGYLQAKLDERAAVADRPTHAPTKVVAKVDGVEAPAKFDPYAVYRKAHAEARK